MTGHDGHTINVGPVTVGIDLDAIAAREPVTLSDGVTAITHVTVAERDALVAAARENTALREALGDLLGDECHEHRSYDPTTCGDCLDPWPCRVERARAILDGAT